MVGVALFYPYCGLGSRARRRGWRHWAEVLLVLAVKNAIVRNETCLAAAGSLCRRGHPVELAVIPGVNHGFDDTSTFPGSSWSTTRQRRGRSHPGVPLWLG